MPLRTRRFTFWGREEAYARKSSLHTTSTINSMDKQHGSSYNAQLAANTVHALPAGTHPFLVQGKTQSHQLPCQCMFEAATLPPSHCTYTTIYIRS